LGAVEDAGDVDLQRLEERRLADLTGRRIDAGVVDQDRRRADLVEHAPERRAVRDVRLDDPRAPRPNVAPVDLRALGSERPGPHRAEIPERSGDDGDAALEAVSAQVP